MCETCTLLSAARPIMITGFDRKQVAVGPNQRVEGFFLPRLPSHNLTPNPLLYTLPFLLPQCLQSPPVLLSSPLLSIDLHRQT